MKNEKRTKRIATYVFLILVSLIFFFPFYFLIVSISNPSIDITRGKLLPGSHLIENFKTMIETTPISLSIWNSALVSVGQTIISIFVSSLAGYGFEVHPSRGKEVVYNIILLSMMIPFAALMVPLFRLFGTISGIAPALGIDTLFGVVLPYVSTAFLVFFFRQNTKMFPKELIEAGRIDGLSELGIFVKIFIPTMKTTYAAAGIVTFMNSWNNYLWPLIVLQSPENYTVPLVISAMGSGYTIDYGSVMIAIFITTIPTAIIFFVLQKYFVQGMVGSLK
ncbi:lactose/L-arabinose transport system permease protein [Alkalibacterium putridalgicola]|uniref:Lactose ABC transporter permease n=1 Tax=Alkalibacterium putridalgicola TaxID=426703 RepID=A0A1H7TFB2_9LACT|nr:carbohydrate ABC transporter permease [Alkalibacterium putridalgicola]GEK89432.1 lactose ABC transporter permease [Alkalibacterium putridalgicola]SEL82996.1 lactose/L-arabinose transport system permease protein [Alkalibacterium putridalgicola]